MTDRAARDPITRLNTALEGRYRIERQLGEGGMATVYLAEDLKHKRQVAIKVLKPDLAAVVGGDRFLAEIETTANLQHPHILPLFDSGQADGYLFFVMPYIEGETLRDRLNREKQLPVDEAVGIARAVAAALSVAHERGVIHRDIKPANILLSRGEPLVADFGIALAVTQAGGGRLTETGLSVGTPYYMSPEQATGDRDITASSDVYALGCILFEMLVGEPPYVGNTAQAVLGKILTEDPRPPTRIRASVPRNVDSAVMKALEKLPADRFRTAEDFGRALGDRGFRYGNEEESAPGAGLAAGGGRGWKIAAGVSGTAAVLMAGLLALGGSGGDAPPPASSRSVFAMPPGQELMDELFSTVAFSPDGSALVYVGPGDAGSQLLVKDRDSHEARVLPGTQGGETPAVSPDGEWVAYIAGGRLYKTPLRGGPSTALSDSAQSDVGSMAWMESGEIAYVDRRMRIALVPEDGGSQELVFEPDQQGFTLSLSPVRGRDFLFVRCEGACRLASTLWAWDGESGELREVEESVSGAWYVEPGFLVLARPSGSVFAARFDPETLSIAGEPVPLFEGVEVDLDLVPDLAVGRSGEALAQIGDGTSQSLQFYWIDRSGERTPVDPDFAFAPSTFVAWRLSPDSRKVAFAQSTDAGDDIWVKELDAGSTYRLTFDPELDFRPEWSPDGEYIFWVTSRAGNRDLYRRRSNATGQAELLLDREKEISQGTWSPDGNWLVYREGTGDGRDIWAFRPGQDSVPSPLIADPRYDEKAAAVSPDGNWIAYESTETGQDEIYIRPFPDVESGKWQVSVGGGREPVWGHSGRELFYIKPGNVMVAASVQPGPPFSVGARTELFALGSGAVPGTDHTSYDVDGDDQRFLFALPRDGELQSRAFWLRIQNWGSDLGEILGERE